MKMCASCTFSTENPVGWLLKYKMRMNKEDTEVDLCQFCAGSQASNSFQYPNQYPDSERHILIAIAYAGNVILEAINNKK